MALIKACLLLAAAVQNTGKECDISMGPTAMLIAVPKGTVITSEDLEDPINWLETLIHEQKKKRAYPLFGHEAPIRTIQNNKEQDVLVTLDDGSTTFVRYGFVNRMFETTSGGICYAKALESFAKANYNFIEVDIEGKVLLRRNVDGTYGALRTDFAYSPSPTLADFKNPYKNNFQISYNPDDYIKNGVIFAGGEELLSKMGLIDAKLVKVSAISTKIVVKVISECAENNISGGEFATSWPSAGIITVKNGNTSVTTTNTVVDDGENSVIELAGTFAPGTYTVTVAPPSDLFDAGIAGYEVTSPLNVVVA